MNRIQIGSIFALATIVLAGCAGDTRAAKVGEKTEFIVVNNAGRALSLQPMMSTRAAASVDIAGLKGKGVKLFEEAGKMSGASSQYVIYVVEKPNDADETVVSVVRLSPEELAYAEKAGPVRISLEPNKVFVKFGTRFKTYEYTTKPAIAGEMNPPAEKEEKKADAAKK